MADLTSFHAEHHRASSALERRAERLVDALGRPAVALGLTVAVVLWIGLAVLLTGPDAVARPPFAWLELIATVTALLISMLILAAQRRAGQLAERRDKLTLELALLSDRRSAKIIELLEDLRRDLPSVGERHDPEAAGMRRPSDPKAVLDAIDRHAQADEPTGSELDVD
ncbi:DUF1003 domain-containing protein [Caulobacter sp. KR2-114]|uniref:DUF1003 domain-containing protein n=1 Tax=Caulobacter sp. KR2-114 TaxID=3400912 RepID=UPI003C0C2750